MRYLSLIAASFLLVGCAQSTDVQSEMTQDTDIQTQQEAESTETEIETEEESNEATEQDPPAETEAEEVESEEESESESEEMEGSEEEYEPAEESEELEGDSAEDQAGEEEQSEAVEDDAAGEEVEEEEVATGYTISDVRDNDSASSCWAAIDGSVYDLTDWINRHPGGASRIISLCGTDATTAFNGMHGGQSRPESTLDGYLLGPLS